MSSEKCESALIRHSDICVRIWTKLSEWKFIVMYSVISKVKQLIENFLYWQLTYKSDFLSVTGE